MVAEARPLLYLNEQVYSLCVPNYLSGHLAHLKKPTSFKYDQISILIASNKNNKLITVYVFILNIFKEIFILGPKKQYFYAAIPALHVQVCIHVGQPANHTILGCRSLYHIFFKKNQRNSTLANWTTLCKKYMIWLS